MRIDELKRFVELPIKQELDQIRSQVRDTAAKMRSAYADLVIDQPEDDIDSKMVKDIIDQVWKAKTKRQVIVASHSANFVVNGDAELVVCCDYIKAGDQTHGAIKALGAIDNQLIKEEITLVTEGGRQAFKLRMDKYGF